MSSIVLTDKFAKEVEKFFVWASVGYSVQDISGDTKVWSLSLLKSFDEPARNKLETFIKELMKKYTISMGDEIVEDFKLFAKAYKEAPKVKKETKAKLTKEPKKVVQKGHVNDKMKTEPKKTDIVVDANLDTSDTWHLETLEFDTRQLVKAFGTPLKNGGNEGDEHKYEWKLKVLGTEGVYTIYDFINEDGSYDDFDEAEWYLGGDNENKENIQKIIKYIINCEGKNHEVKELTVVKEVKKSVTVKKEVKQPEIVKKVKETETLKDLFGDEDDNAFSFNKGKDDNLVFDQASNEDSDEDIVLDLNDLDNLDEDFEF